MKIIDAHLHIFAPSPHPDAMAQAVGHQNSTEHLRQVYGELGMVHGVVMGNRSLEPSCHDYPAGLFHYCIGLDSVLMERGTRPVPDLADKVEENLKRETCCGVKLYPGYNRLWLSDPVYQPIYELAARYGKPTPSRWMRWRRTTNTPGLSCAISATPFWKALRRWWRKIPMWPLTCPACWRAGWISTVTFRNRRATPPS